MSDARNVFGEELEVCCTSPLTGFYRNGKCETGRSDVGTHVVCARVAEDFLTFTRLKGNDLTTASPMHDFPGLKPGDRWCLCALRWKESLDAGCAPPVILEATHEKVLRYVTLYDLKAHAVDRTPRD